MTFITDFDSKPRRPKLITYAGEPWAVSVVDASLETGYSRKHIHSLIESGRVRSMKQRIPGVGLRRIVSVLDCLEAGKR